MTDEENTWWMLVNKQWYKWYQSIKYKEITIGYLNSSYYSTILNSIINSKFQPGKWTKSVIFMGMVGPKWAIIAYNATLISSDPLHLLMIHGPNVKEVRLPSGMDDGQSSERKWAYCIKALMNTNTWNLHTLSLESWSHASNGDTSRRAYFSCLMHLKRSIKHLPLTKRIIDYGDYECL